MIESYRAECGHCNLWSSPMATVEQVEGELVCHFGERHPERLGALRAMIAAGDLPVVRREPTWEPMPAWSESG